MRFPYTFVGQCIYCGSTKEPLTREHVLPKGLAGNEPPEGASEALVLRKASCTTCQEITLKFEQECLRDMLGPARRRLGLTRKDRRSATMPVLVSHPDETDATVQELIDLHVLGAMAIPAFRTAQCFANATEKDLGVDYKFIWVERAVIPEGASSVGVELKANKVAFARMLAKIGLGLATACYGKEAFVPFVQRIITGEDTNIHRFIGGFCEEIPEPSTDGPFHAMKLLKHDGMLIANIQLFAQFGGPINYVVLGYLVESGHMRT
jgi:hypothetical protein